MAYIDEHIRNFLVASIEGTMEDFDFDDAFDEIEPVIQSKLAEHGLLSYDEFVETDENVCYCNPTEAVMPFTTDTGYILITADEILDVIRRHRYERFREEFSTYDSFKTLADLYRRVQEQSCLDTTEKVLLFDECIHAQHETGDIFDDVDIERIKADIDAEYATA